MEFVEKHIAEQNLMSVRIVQSIWSGPPAVGKTSTRKRLTGSIRTRNPLPSTGIEIPHTTTLFHKTEQHSFHLSKSLKEWEEQDLEAQCQTLLEHIMLVPQVGSDQTTQQLTEEVHQDPSLLAFPEAEHSSNIANLSFDPTMAVQIATRSSNLPPSAPQRNLLKDGALRRFIQNVTATKKFKEVCERPKAIEDITILHITDAGGQPEFQDILPLLLQGPAIFLLFLKLTRGLHELCEIAYRWEGGRSSTVYTSQFTFMDMLFQLLASVASCSADELNAAVMFIGTHLDQAGEEGWHYREKELMDAIKSTEFFEKDVVKTFTRDGKESLIFPLDNFGGSVDEVESLRDSLADIIEKAFHPVHIPISWLLFHLVLRSEYEASPGYCTLEECKKVAESCGIPASDIVNILRFIHKRFGTILYYSDVASLADVVICDPNVIFMRVNKLVTLSFGANPYYPNTSEKIRNSGEIDPSQMEAEMVKEGSSFSMSRVVNLLTYYNIISKVKKSGDSHVYFMPCLLRPAPIIETEEKEALHHFDPAPLLILFSTGYIPLGLFSALIVYLSEQRFWELDGDKPRYRNKVPFIVGESTELALMSHINCLELRVEPTDFSDFATIHLDMVDTVMDAIKHLKSRHMYVKFNNSLGFYCHSGLEMENGSPHPAKCHPQQSPRFMKCQRKPNCKSSKLLDKHKVWFNQYSGVSADSDKAASLLPQQPPLLPVKTADPLTTSILGSVCGKTVGSVHGVKECGETLLEITGSKHQNFSWEDYGFYLTVPDGAVSSDVTVSVAVKAILAGQFQLPDDTHLVSAIYWVSSSEMFDKAVSVYIQHCAIISSKEEASKYKFIVGKSSQKSPPYTFQILDGDFSTLHPLATISLKQFSFFGAIFQGQWGSNKCRYMSHCYFKRDPENTSSYECRFLVIHNLPPFLQVVKETYKDWNLHHMAEVEFEEKPPVGEEEGHREGGPASMSITLEITAPEEGESKEWDICQVTPLQILKRSVDESYKGYSTHIPYHQIAIDWKGPETAKVPIFRHRINLVGAKRPNNFFYLHFRPSPSSSSVAAAISAISAAGSATHDDPTVLSIEDLVCVREELASFTKWKQLGEGLGLGHARLEVIEEDYQGANRLLQVLVHWLLRNYNEDKHGRPTWKSLIAAVDPVNQELAKTIERKHC